VVEYYKMCLPFTPDMTSAKKAFEASAECNEFQGENHCVRHVHMETTGENITDRKSHHNGTRSCHCKIPCIGDRVSNHWTSDDYKLVDELLHRRRPSTACQAVGCNTRAREGDWCSSHRYQCTTVDCTGRAARLSRRCACCISKSICGVQDCLSRPMAGDWCSLHKVACQSADCIGRTDANGRLCQNCRGTRSVCLIDDCDCKAENGDWCSSHREPCATPDCRGRTTNKHCVACLGTRTGCPVQGCKTSVNVNRGVYCYNHAKQCQIAGCSGRTKEKRCKECLEAGRKLPHYKRKRKSAAPDVEGDDAEEEPS